MDIFAIKKPLGERREDRYAKYILKKYGDNYYWKFIDFILLKDISNYILIEHDRQGPPIDETNNECCRFFYEEDLDGRESLCNKERGV